MARLTKEQLADKTRYRFRKQEVDLPELDGSVQVKTLSVGEREDLPDLVDADGKSIAGIGELARVCAAVVVDPRLTSGEWEEFLADLPATVLDRVIEAFGELLGTNEKESAATRREFRSSPE